MDNEPNLDSLFEDAVKLDTPAEEKPAEQPEEKPAEEKPETPADNVQKEEQDQAERARQAMARRLREAEERGAKAERERVSALIAELDLDDPNNEDVKIDSVDKVAEYLERQRKKRFAAGNPKESDIIHVIREEREREQRAATPPTPPEEDPKIKAELAEIHAMDPSINKIDDILKSDAGPKFREYVMQRGMTFVEAYTLAAKDRLASIQANREGARSSGKEHLNATTQRGAGALDVPSAEMVLFRELNPGVSDADIQKYYNADRKRYGPK